MTLDQLLALHYPKALAGEAGSAAVCVRVLELQAVRLGISR